MKKRMVKLQKLPAKSESLPYVALVVPTHIVPSYPFYIYVSFIHFFLVVVCMHANIGSIYSTSIDSVCLHTPISQWLNDEDDDDDDDNDNDKVDGDGDGGFKIMIMYVIAK